MGVNLGGELAGDEFIGEAIAPVGDSFATRAMAGGGPGLPRRFVWRGEEHQVERVLAQWKESGDCRHGSGGKGAGSNRAGSKRAAERYVRKHWFRVRTAGGLEMRLYFERQKRSGKARWWLYSVDEHAATDA